MAQCGPPIAPSMIHKGDIRDPVCPLHCADEGMDLQEGRVPQSKGMAEPGVKMYSPEVTALKPMKHKMKKKKHHLVTMI